MNVNEVNTHIHDVALKETDFMANEVLRLKEFASLIRVCGKTPSEIAKACNLDVRTVQRALKGKPLKSDAQARVQLYIKKVLQDGT